MLDIPAGSYQAAANNNAIPARHKAVLCITHWPSIQLARVFCFIVIMRIIDGSIDRLDKTDSCAYYTQVGSNPYWQALKRTVYIDCVWKTEFEGSLAQPDWVTHLKWESLSPWYLCFSECTQKRLCTRFNWHRSSQWSFKTRVRLLFFASEEII